MDITQRQLADASGVNYETLKKLETGGPKVTAEQIIRLAPALLRTPAALVEEATTILADLSVSEGHADNVVSFPSRPDTVEELESYAGPKAAHPREPESDQDE